MQKELDVYSANQSYYPAMTDTRTIAFLSHCCREKVKATFKINYCFFVFISDDRARSKYKVAEHIG